MIYIFCGHEEYVYECLIVIKKKKFESYMIHILLYNSQFILMVKTEFMCYIYTVYNN